jgi:IS5 family transposase
MTGWKVEDAFCERGFRGAGKDHPDVRVHLSWRNNPAMRRWLRRRAAIEPIITHLKSDNGIDRNHLKGKDGDRLNATLAGCGFNLRKFLGGYLEFIFQ